MPKKVIEIITKANSCFKYDLVNKNCPQQKDGYSCRLYMIMNACKIAGYIANKGNKNLSNEMEN